MEFVLLSDTHGNAKICSKAVKLANKRKASVIVAGDLVNWELKNPLKNFKEQLGILNNCKKETYLIPGSHECYDFMKLVDDFKAGKYSNVINIHRKLLKLKSIYLLGYGGSTSITEDILKKGYYFSNPKEDELFLDSLMKNKPLIFVSHMPPHTYLDQAVFIQKPMKNKKLLNIRPAKVGEKGAITKNVGSKALKKVIEKNKPVLSVFGHIHEANGYEELFSHKVVKESKNLLINVGKEKILLVKVEKNKARIIKTI